MLKEELAQLPSGDWILCRSEQMGYSRSEQILPFIFYITWWGIQDPVKDGYKHLFGKLYFKNPITINRKLPKE